MNRCPTCTTELPAISRFCPACGASVAPRAGLNGDATVAMPVSTPPVSSAAGIPSHFEHQRFPPGTLIASRYRIVARLGKGGMGEVFRADDLILGQEVALKFLSGAMAGNVNLLTRFYDEVRIARQITHPNVCRVYDIGEVDGQPYLSMQYIDGEDLGSLLRRIGRLPSDKAIEFTRKLCAGLAAAHAEGVLHRDLKPANIMIDGRGQVIVMDFGLAGIAEHLQGAEVRNGTPAYMAPEQLTGKEVSVRSDIYALGLVLYEMFTGKPAYEAATLADMIRQREQSAPKSLSTYVHDLEPGVERVILQCLDPDPQKRPQSALAVAATLPGGDPLAAALAAGETPTPELVASAGATEGMNPKWAMAALAAVVVVLAALLLIVPRLELAANTPLDNPPEVLQHKARDFIRAAGYGEKPMDRASGFYYDSDYIDYLQKKKVFGLAQWNKVLAQRPSPIEFWYRQSPRALESVLVHLNGQVTMQDPPPSVTGMISAVLDLEGRLQSFSAIPPQFEPAAPAGQAVDWKGFFAAAGLDPALFQTAQPSWAPLSAVDSRAAWTGFYPDRMDIPIRVEAAAWRGKPVYFEIVSPWKKPARMQTEETSFRQRAANFLLMLLLVLLITAGILMARHNARAGRGDFQGAKRLGILAYAAVMAKWSVVTHHVSLADGELTLLGEAAGGALLAGVLLWALYLALEPWVRSRWPHTLITWSRALAGRWRDPLVGRDILFSVLFGAVYCLIIAAFNYPYLFEGAWSPPTNFQVANLMGLRPILGMYAERAFEALQTGPAFFLEIFLLRVLLRKQWLAAVAFVLIWTVLKSLGQDEFIIPAMLFLIIFSFLVVILMRFGLFALTLTVFVLDSTTSMLMTPDVSAWYGLSTAIALTVLLGLAIYGFRTALGGRRLLDDGLLDR